MDTSADLATFHREKIADANSAIHGLLALKADIFEHENSGEMPTWFSPLHAEAIDSAIRSCVAEISSSIEHLRKTATA